MSFSFYFSQQDLERYNEMCRLEKEYFRDNCEDEQITWLKYNDLLKRALHLAADYSPFSTLNLVQKHIFKTGCEDIEKAAQFYLILRDHLRIHKP